MPSSPSVTSLPLDPHDPVFMMSSLQGEPPGTGPTHRNHHQRHPRFPPRETTDTSARTAGDRLPRQPTTAARPTTQPRPDHRRRRPHRDHRSGHHRHRHPCPGTAVRRPTQPRPALRTADLPTAPQRLHQQGPAHSHRRTARTRPGHGVHRADDLRPASTENPQPHRPNRGHPPLPGHRPWTRHREVPHLRPRPGPAHRARRTCHPDNHSRPSAISCHRLPQRRRHPHRHSITRSLKYQAVERDPHTTNLTPKPGYAALSYLVF
uniref:Uncharacterized protein n=1 Tax=Rhodococcus sp. NS1 TaxID=402236 RepID=A0A097SQY6_9NOCA|nr:hypothetical protein LRS1606.486 [Rhodococcus sp. NS1]